MGIKTFTAGIPTASEINLYSTKGDTFIKEANVTAGSIVNCFSMEYENYLVVVSNFVATVDCYLYFQLGYGGGTSYTSAAGQYFSGGQYTNYSGGAVTNWFNNGTDGFMRVNAGCSAATNLPNNSVVNISSPNKSTWTRYSALATLNLSSGNYGWWHGGNVQNTQTYDSVRWLTTAGAVSSGTVQVYGLSEA